MTPATWPAAVKRMLKWAPGATPEQRAHAIASGLHWVAPIGSTTYRCWIGVRLLGGVPLECCPVVMCHQGNVATVATEVRESLAVMLWWLGLRDDPGSLQVVRSKWPQIRGHVEDQAEGMGGLAAVERFSAFLDDEPDPGLALPANDPDYLAAVARVIGRLDPAQAAFRRTIVELAAGANPEPGEEPAAWREMLDATRYVKKRADSEAAWRVARSIPSLDKGVRLVVGHFVNTKMDWSHADIELASKVAMRVVREGPDVAPVAALVAARASDRPYDGMAHVEAATQAAMSGEHARAWVLLAGAGYWTRQRFGKANPVVAEAAQQLCREAGWAEASAALEP